jgi:hypothetical protein
LCCDTLTISLETRQLQVGEPDGDGIAVTDELDDRIAVAGYAGFLLTHWFPHRSSGPSTPSLMMVPQEAAPTSESNASDVVLWRTIAQFIYSESGEQENGSSIDRHALG